MLFIALIKICIWFDSILYKYIGLNNRKKLSEMNYTVGSIYWTSLYYTGCTVNMLKYYNSMFIQLFSKRSSWELLKFEVSLLKYFIFKMEENISYCFFFIVVRRSFNFGILYKGTVCHFIVVFNCNIKIWPISYINRSFLHYNYLDL